MSIPNKSLIVLCTGLVAGAALLVACGKDDTGTTPGGENTPEDPGNTSGGTSGTSGTPGGGNHDSGGNPDGSSGDAGHDNDGGGDGGGSGKANGESCTTPSDTSSECASGVCASFGGGSGGGALRNQCTVKCDKKNSDNDPKCAGGDPFTGQCNGKGYCAVEQQ